MALELGVWVDWSRSGNFYTPSTHNIAPYVMEVSASAGIFDPLERVAAVGTLSILLDNQTQRFSPAYTSGPLYGQLVPGTPLRVELYDDVLIYPVFEGVIRTITPQSGLYGERRARIEAVDAMQVLQDHTISIPLQTDKNMSYLLRLITASVWRTGLATGTITFTGLPSAADTVTVNGQVYTFRSGSVSSAGDVLIGATIEETAENLAAAINNGAGSGDVYGTNTQRPADCVAAVIGSHYRLVAGDYAVRYYRLGEPSGTTANDVGSNNKPATYVGGVTLGAGGALANDPDTAASFDGIDDYVSVPVFDIENRSFSLSCWIRPDVSPPLRQDVVGWWGADGTSLVLYSDGTIIFAIADFVMVASAAGAISFGDWHHVAFTYDYAADHASLYVDGALVDENDIGPVTDTKTACNIGCTLAGFNHFAGRIDEVAMRWHCMNAAQVAAEYSAQAVAPGVRIEANARGEWGNAITLAKSGANIVVSGATLANGSDLHNTLFDFEAGREPFEVAGDLWSGGDTNALTAIEDVVDSEYGLFWCDRNGVLVARDRDWENTQAYGAAYLSISSDHNELEFADECDLLYNRVVVSFTPRGTISEGTIARARGIVTVPPRTGNERWSAGQDIDPSSLAKPEAGIMTVLLPYVDTSGGGRLIGAQSLTLPIEPGVDYRVGDSRDGTNSSSTYDYTYDPSLIFSVAQTGSGVEVSIKNTAIGALYVSDLQVRGVGLVAYDEQQAVIDDSASMDAHGRRTLNVTLPLSSSQAFARSLAEFLLGKYKTPTQRITRISFTGQQRIGAVSLFQIGIGYTIDVTDAQTGIASQRYLVTGVQYEIRAGNPLETRISWAVRRLDDRQYLMIDHPMYGLPNGTYYPSL